MAADHSRVISHEHDTLEQVEALVEHLHNSREKERVALARKLHDELGGFLVSAVMDLGWAEQHLTSIEPLSARLRRVRTSLAAAIDLKRAMTEILRPTLLDNFGLFAACRWHFKHLGIHPATFRTERYPGAELMLTDRALTGLFRTVQDLLELTLRETDIKAIDLSLSTSESELRISVQHEHTCRETMVVSRDFGMELASVSHRLTSLQGRLAAAYREFGSGYHVSVPLREVLLPA